MKQQTESCRIVYDSNGTITDWICQHLAIGKNWLDTPFYTIGFVVGNKIIGGLIYHNIRYHHDLWLTIYTTDKRWCTRRVLKIIFELAFNFWQAKRISILVSINNPKCIILIQKLGFKREGLLRGYQDDGTDCYFYGMLQSENKWSKSNEQSNR